MTAASASTSARTSARDAATTGQRPRPDRNLAVELVRATEAAAMASAGWLGRGDKNQVDGAAVDAMRPVLGTVSMRGVVVIGEGEKDNAPMLYNGEEVGDGNGPEVDIAVDPIDGTTLAAMALPDALSVVALSERGRMFDPGPCVYMRKTVVPAAAVSSVDPEAPVETTIAAVAKALGRQTHDLTVAVLDRPRHEHLVASIRATGARIRFLRDGDVAGSIMVAADDMDTGVDLLLGTGGTPEGVIAAAALRCLGGEIFAKLAPRDDERAGCGAGAGLRPRQDPDHQGSGRRQRRLLRRDRRDRRRAAARGQVRHRARDHVLPVDAGPLRHDPTHRDLSRSRTQQSRAAGMGAHRLGGTAAFHNPTRQCALSAGLKIRQSKEIR